MQIARLHRFVSPAEFDVFIFFWEGKKTALLKRHKKLFKFCARKKIKIPSEGYVRQMGEYQLSNGKPRDFASVEPPCIRYLCDT
jgi:hypothetical protein